MKTWDDWSDFDLSFKVAKLSMPSNDNIQELLGNVCTGAVSGHNADSYQFVYFDINKPADMWPIILENNIVVTPCVGANIGNATGYSEHQNPVISEFSDNSKALRAAAIVFLMMNGVNPE